MRGWRGLVVFLLLAFGAGVSGSQTLPDAWYYALAKPAFTPPNWVFPVVWSVLYVVMAVAAWRVYRKAGFGIAIGLWIAQLVFNAAWSPLFFGLHRVDLALVDVLILVALVTTTAILFFRRDRVAGLLMIPYMAWGAFASALTFAILRMNPA